jgi:DNA-binding XRE family transcriptional regulator
LTGLRNLRTLRAVTHKQFAKLLTDWRNQNELTQQTAADKLGVSRRSLENWEQERAMPQGFGLKAMLVVIQGAKAKPDVKPQRRRK